MEPPDSRNRPGSLSPERAVDAFLRPGGRPRVIAHRGFSAAAPENTLAAFREALALGRALDMVELDVTSSRDGEVMVFHDERLNRTTNGSGLLQSKTLEVLRRLDAGSWFDVAFSGERIPTLEEALDLLVPHLLVNVEIKGEAVDDRRAGGFVERVAERIRRAGATDQVLVSSFEPLALEQMRRIDPEIRTASLYQRRAHKRLGADEIMAAVGARAFHINGRWITPETVELCHAVGRLIAAYTVNEIAEMDRLLDLGVDALFTDRPDLLIAHLEDRPGTHENV